MNDKDLKETDKQFVPHPEIEERSWPAIVGLTLAVLSSLAMFVLPKATEKGLLIQISSVMAASVVSAVLCYFGIKKSPIIALVGIAVALLLFVTLLCGLIGTLAS